MNKENLNLKRSRLAEAKRFLKVKKRNVENLSKINDGGYYSTAQINKAGN